MVKNNREQEVKSLAIVGAGPRGLSALESVYGALAFQGNPKSLNTFLFEANELPGAGHVYDLEQLDTNWLNISERGLTLPKREEIKCDNLVIPSFPSYQKWACYDLDMNSGIVADKFPLRSTLGKYLNERYKSIATVLQDEGLLTVIRGEVIESNWKEGLFELVVKDGGTYHTNEVVLTLGHQSTYNDDQITNWLSYNHTKTSVALITEPYPVKNFLKLDQLNSDIIVALRGFGLAMIDVMRALTTGLGGKFEMTNDATQEMVYTRSGKEPNKIVPFSLDGLPMAPKPLNFEIDEWFFPTDVEKEVFKSEVSTIAQRGAVKDHQFLIDAITPIIFRVFKELEDKAYASDLNKSALYEIIKSWLSDEKFEHDLIVPKNNPAEKTLKAFVGMAIGTKQVSLDFCIGHVWRHCQPTLYKAVSFSNLDDNVIASVVALDERLKRYSYGPPVGSLQQLLALIKAEVVTLDFVNNPEIKTTDQGWKLSMENKAVQVEMMINSVLDSPKLLDVNSLLVRNLLQDSLVEPVHGELGIDTYKNACVCLSADEDKIPLAVLGRLSKGTLIGVDAILECFGIRSDLWAEGLVNRIRAKV